MARKKFLLAGIDVGTTKICSTIARVDGDHMEVLGTGWAPSRGLKKGIVINLSQTVESVRASLEEAENQASSVVEAAYISVGGSHIRGFNCAGETEIRSKSGEVSPDDVTRAIEDAKDFDLPTESEVIHVLTRSFTLDGQNGIINPLGMSGRHLAVELHLVLNATAVVQNIVNAINKAGVVVNGVVMQQLASAEAVLSEDEKELGSVLIDIGGGTTDIAIYQQGSICHSEVLPLGGSLITKDIAIGLKAPLQEAEQLKKETGSVFPNDVPEEEIIEVDQVGTGFCRSLPRRLLCQILQARCDEILDETARVMRRTGVDSDLITGVVLTGGGSLLDGLLDRSEEVFDLPVRLGYPCNVVPKGSEICHPSYSTCLGLLKYARDVHGEEVAGQTAAVLQALSERPAYERLKSWLLEKIGAEQPQSV